MFTGYAFILATVGLIRRLPLARWAGMVLMGMAVLKLLVVDSQQAMPDPSTFVAFLNIRFLVFSVVLAALLGMAYWFWRESPRLSETERYAWQGLLAAANLVGVWALSQEILRYFGSLEFGTRADYFSAKHLSLTVLWAAYAVGVIGAGITLRSAKVRLIGMALLTISGGQAVHVRCLPSGAGVSGRRLRNLGSAPYGNGSGVSTVQSGYQRVPLCPAGLAQR